MKTPPCFDLGTFEGRVAFAAYARARASGPLAALDIETAVDPALRGLTVRPEGPTRLYFSRRALRLFRDYADRIPDDPTPAGTN